MFPSCLKFQPQTLCKDFYNSKFSTFVLWERSQDCACLLFGAHNCCHGLDILAGKVVNIETYL